MLTVICFKSDSKRTYPVKLKKTYLLIITLLFAANTLSAQKYASGKGAFIITGAACFTNTKEHENNTDAYTGNVGFGKYNPYDYSIDKNVTSVLLNPSIDYFITRNIFIGSAFQYSGEKEYDINTSNMGIGPEFGIIFAKPESIMLPFISTGYLFMNHRIKYSDASHENNSGSEYFISCGVIVPVQKHIGVTISGVYQNLKYKLPTHSISGNIIALSLGLSGLLY